MTLLKFITWFLAYVIQIDNERAQRILHAEDKTVGKEWKESFISFTHPSLPFLNFTAH